MPPIQVFRKFVKDVNALVLSLTQTYVQQELKLYPNGQTYERLQ